MSYNSDFERAFMERSLELVKQYQGPYDATLLLNCLLGLLVVPKERCLEAIPEDPIGDQRKWGISPDAIQDRGASQGGTNDPTTLRVLVRRLRNAVAHSRFEPDPPRGEVEAFCFRDKGFRARVELSELREFVEKLAEKLKEM